MAREYNDIPSLISPSQFRREGSASGNPGMHSSASAEDDDARGTFVTAFVNETGSRFTPAGASEDYSGHSVTRQGERSYRTPARAQVAASHLARQATYDNRT